MISKIICFFKGHVFTNGTDHFLGTIWYAYIHECDRCGYLEVISSEREIPYRNKTTN